MTGEDFYDAYRKPDEPIFQRLDVDARSRWNDMASKLSSTLRHVSDLEEYILDLQKEVADLESSNDMLAKELMERS